MLDDPTFSLEPIVVEGIARLIKSLKFGGLAILLSEQNAEMALSVADRAYVLEKGRLAPFRFGQDYRERSSNAARLS